ncbi:MAG: PHP domain-containing protein [Clostridia bacterium]|nr:PHP domain-containing protein [Clostridia bacterium]
MFYDLHIHSCLSPCGDNDMTPNNIVNMAMINGLDLIALTDHNSTRNCAAAMAVGREVGVLVVPGMELTTAEDIHVVCLFPSIETAESFDRYVYGCLPPIPNREKIFGEQLLCDAEDNVVGKEERLLITATSIGLDTVPELVASYGGVAFLAHIDRKSNGALAILGSLSEDLGFDLAEVSKLSRPADYAGRFPFLSFVGDSDAHQLTDIAEGGGDNELAAAFESATDVVEYFRNIAKK